jgi:hypothetical protein
LTLLDALRNLRAAGDALRRRDTAPASAERAIVRSITHLEAGRT